MYNNFSTGVYNKPSGAVGHRPQMLSILCRVALFCTAVGGDMAHYAALLKTRREFRDDVRPTYYHLLHCRSITTL